MHDVSLGTTLEDFLTGEEIEQTTYEDLRQVLARILVEEKGYPKSSVKARVKVSFPIDDRTYTRIADLAAYDESGCVLMVMIFCPGVVSTFQREAVAAARLFPNGPAPLVVVTDTKEALVLATGTGEELGEGMIAIPAWERLQELAATYEMAPLGDDWIEKERRILYAYSESLCDCSDAACTLASKGGRWG